MYFASMGLYTLVTLERYYAICIPLKHRAIAGKRRTLKIIIANTFVSIILGVLVSLKDGRVGSSCVVWPDDEEFNNFPSIIKDCVTIHPDVVIMGEVLQTAPFFVAMIWNGYMYVVIIYTLNKRKAEKITDGKNSQMQEQATQVRNQVARLLILNGNVFFGCQVIYRFVAVHIIMKLTVGFGIFNSDEALGLVVIISRGLLYLNSSINPILYNLSSSFYYEAFKEAFGCKKTVTGSTGHTCTPTMSTRQ
ncbi:orexin/Hypocretin receptor type 1-like [Amphiura filiformis]|uniref:orexin/Hypocretin receptor type 1-like n=1 Tax=Amphiura filiformis TaxID=82378 RepID=UPI003B21EDE0